MPHFTSQGLSIHYLDNENMCPETLVFIHGNSLSSKSFLSQFKASEFKKFRCIALDLPGHGESEAAKDYDIFLFRDVVKDLIDQLSLQKVILVGHSLGGHIALHSLPFIRAAGVFVFGTPPLSLPLSMEAFKSHPQLPLLFKNVLSSTEISDLLRAMYSEKEIGPEEIIEFQKVDIHFRESMAQSFANGKLLDECHHLKNFDGEVAVVTLENDNFINNSYIEEVVPHNRRRFFKGSHNSHIEFKEDFNKLLLSFCEDAFKKVDSVGKFGTSKDLSGMESRKTAAWSDSERTC